MRPGQPNHAFYSPAASAPQFLFCRRFLEIATVIVIEPLDVVFAEIFSALYLDQYRVFLAGVTKSMHDALRYVNAFAGSERYLFSVKSYNRRSLEEVPVFRAAQMALKAQTFPGIDRDAFHLVVGFLCQHFIKSPRPLVFFFYTLEQRFRLRIFIIFLSNHKEQKNPGNAFIFRIKRG